MKNIEKYINEPWNTATIIQNGLHLYFNGCNCNFCRGQKTMAPPDGWDDVSTGGRYPVVIHYDPQKIKVVWVSAKGNYDSCIDTGDKLIYDIPASVHGCFKLQKRQRLLIFLKAV